MLGDLIAQACFEAGDAEFFLAEQGKLTALPEAEEVGQSGGLMPSARAACSSTR